MVSFSSLDEQLSSCLNEIEQQKISKNYKSMMSSITKAMDLCQKIHDSTSDYKKKKMMETNAINLKGLYRECQDKLGLEASANPVNKSVKIKTPSSKTNSGTSKVEADGIQYEFNGVDVKKFLIIDSNDPVMFDDVIGMEEEKKLIKREFFLTEKQIEFKKIRHMAPKTFLLLYGVPGTGKTFFAKAISNELKKFNKGAKNVPFIAVVGDQLKGSLVGETEHNIQALFEFCKQFDHCVLFIDEFDSLVPDRAKATGDPTANSRVTTFLQMLDGFSSATGTLLISATNCPYNIDGAVLSRANAEIEIPLPSKKVILSTLARKLHTSSGDLYDSSVNLEEEAEKLEGYSNRDIKNLINNLNDQCFDKFDEDQSNGIEKNIYDYKITAEMFDEARKTIGPSVKKEDIVRIAKYKNKSL